MAGIGRTGTWIITTMIFEHLEAIMRAIVERMNQELDGLQQRQHDEQCKDSFGTTGVVINNNSGEDCGGGDSDDDDDGVDKSSNKGEVLELININKRLLHNLLQKQPLFFNDALLYIVPQVLFALRSCRFGLVQTPEQLAFIAQALNYFMKQYANSLQ